MCGIENIQYLWFCVNIYNFFKELSMLNVEYFFLKTIYVILVIIY